MHIAILLSSGVLSFPYFYSTTNNLFNDKLKYKNTSYNKHNWAKH